MRSIDLPAAFTYHREDKRESNEDACHSERAEGR